MVNTLAHLGFPAVASVGRRLSDRRNARGAPVAIARVRAMHENKVSWWESGRQSCDAA